MKWLAITILCWIVSVNSFCQPILRNPFTTNANPLLILPFTNNPAIGITPTSGTNPPMSGVSSFSIPFIGYSNAANFGTNYLILLFNNSSNIGVAYNYTYNQSTNLDGSIDTVFRSGFNTGPFMPIIVSKPASYEQREYHFSQGGAIPVCEWFWGFVPTNGVESRFFSWQMNETNGYISGAVNANQFNFAQPTNIANSPIQITFQGAGVNALADISLLSSTFLNWSSTSLNAPIMEATDSGGNTRVMFQWSSACGGTGCLYISPNNDIASLQISTDILVLNSHPIGRADTPTLSPGYLALANTTNQIYFGATNTAPANTTTPVKWVSVRVQNDTGVYRLPLYQ